jgi:hypothetical protein
MKSGTIKRMFEQNGAVQSRAGYDKGTSFQIMKAFESEDFDTLKKYFFSVYKSLVSGPGFASVNVFYCPYISTPLEVSPLVS